MIKAEEISDIIKRQLQGYEAEIDLKEAGRVIEVGDGIARIYGLEKALAGELLEFPGGVFGLVLNLEADNVGAVLLGDDTKIKEGDPVARTKRIAQVPVGEALVGRVVNALGQWEFLGMFHQAKGDNSRRVKSILLGSLLILSFCTAHPSSLLCPPGMGFILCNPSTVLFVLVWCLFFLFLFHLVSYGHIENLSQDLAVHLLGLLYLPFLLGHLIWLRFLAQEVPGSLDLAAQPDYFGLQDAAA